MYEYTLKASVNGFTEELRMACEKQLVSFPCFALAVCREVRVLLAVEEAVACQMRLQSLY